MLPRSISGTIRRSTIMGCVLRRYATEAIPLTTAVKEETSTTKEVEASKKKVLQNFMEPAKYALVSLRSFPSLEPHSVIPVHSNYLSVPLRRDILWLAVTMELDNRRVGSSNPPGRSQGKYSRRKLRKQKGSGMARVGDANSPTRENGAYALARNAPSDFSTTLPKKVYHLAYRTAFSEQYRRGHLFVIGQGQNEQGQLKEGDSYGLEICTSDSHSIGMFLKSQNINNHLNVLFVPDDYLSTANLREAVMKYPSSKINVKDKEDVEVRDILKSHRVYMEKGAFEYFVSKYSQFMTL